MTSLLVEDGRLLDRISLLENGTSLDDEDDDPINFSLRNLRIIIDPNIISA